MNSVTASAATTWDYSDLAEFYELRAPYDHSVLSELLRQSGLGPVAAVVDIGAGTGRLTRWLTAEGLVVNAVEPCAPMRVIGQSLSQGLAVRWHARDGLDTGLPDGSAQLVTYGSSFNVLPAAAAINEALRLLGGAGHVLMVWNHRDLTDPLQRAVESLIHARIPNYSGGARREDPVPAWAAHARVRCVRQSTAAFQVQQSVADFVNGFRAHSTLIRQLGSDLESLLREMHSVLAVHCSDGQIAVPFHTRAWCLEVEAPCR